VDFYVSYFCNPGNGAQKVTYNLATGKNEMDLAFIRHAQSRGIPFSAGALQPSGDCSAGGETSIQYWVPRGRIGHDALDPTRPAEQVKGWVLCYRKGGASWIYWTDARLKVYAYAHGPDGERLYDWWSRLAGPRPA
jgi:hypothetical protein